MNKVGVKIKDDKYLRVEYMSYWKRKLQGKQQFYVV
jgi:hypothetical protein